ncbi:hypothetical protein D3C76_1345330 [compost metagenome]
MLLSPGSQRLDAALLDTAAQRQLCSHLHAPARHAWLAVACGRLHLQQGLALRAIAAQPHQAITVAQTPMFDLLLGKYLALAERSRRPRRRGYKSRHWRGVACVG